MSVIRSNTKEEFLNYCTTEMLLQERANELRRLEAKAHRGWTESKGHDVMLKDWTAAIERSNETVQALHIIRNIIREIAERHPEYQY